MEIAKSALQALPSSLQAGPVMPSPGETEADETVNGPDDLHGLALYLPKTLIRTLIKMNVSIGLSYNLQKSSKDHEDRRFFFPSVRYATLGFGVELLCSSF